LSLQDEKNDNRGIYPGGEGKVKGTGIQLMTVSLKGALKN